MYTKKKQVGTFGKKKSVKISNADKWFSCYIRLRDVFTVIGVTPYVKCFTCGRVDLEAKDVHCGHFVPRNRYNIRLDERNAHAQCYNCNIILEGNRVQYAKNLDLVYGAGTADYLEKLGSMQGAKKRLSTLYLREKAKEYNKKTRDLETFLGIYKYFK